MFNRVNFVKDIAKKLFNSNLLAKRTFLTEKQLKEKESEIGARIFGPIHPNERREFFNDNKKSWFFHQEITGRNGVKQSVTLHYEVHPNGILRISSHPDTKNEFIKGQELDNFISATEIYYERVMSQLYNKNIDQTDDKLAA